MTPRPTLFRPNKGVIPLTYLAGGELLGCVPEIPVLDAAWSAINGRADGDINLNFDGDDDEERLRSMTSSAVDAVNVAILTAVAVRT